jgi:DNA protecting protein DprA
MIQDGTIEELLFLSYLTKYNISEIYKIVEEDGYYHEKYSKNQKLIDEVAKTVEITLEKLNYYKIEAIPYFSPKYPKPLLKLKDKPPILYLKGTLKKSKLAAIVGSRDSSKIAPDVVDSVSKVFIEYKIGIASGLALGIDTLAHNSAINNGGYTVAVLPTSLENIYPSENYKLANKILSSSGALVSEIPIGINRGKLSFIERNRIISALSEFVVPIEMGTSSGTMHTVNFCVRQNKKLLLPIPSQNTIEKYRKHYEGISFLLAKYKDEPKGNVVMFRNSTDLKEAIKRKDSGVQRKLF